MKAIGVGQEKQWSNQSTSSPSSAGTRSASNCMPHHVQTTCSWGRMRRKEGRMIDAWAMIMYQKSNIKAYLLNLFSCCCFFPTIYLLPEGYPFSVMVRIGRGWARRPEAASRHPLSYHQLDWMWFTQISVCSSSLRDTVALLLIIYCGETSRSPFSHDVRWIDCWEVEKQLRAVSSTLFSAVSPEWKSRNVPHVLFAHPTGPLLVIAQHGAWRRASESTRLGKSKGGSKGGGTEKGAHFHNSTCRIQL